MIVIIGDSWGLGEFDRNSHLSGPGVGQYLMLHDRVVNLSVAAGSNSESLDRLQDFLDRYRMDDCDVVYWIVTCPTRCSNGPDYFLQSTLTIANTAQDLLYRALDRGQQLAEKHHLRLQLIGGLCDLDPYLAHDRPHINIRVSSWSQLIRPQHPLGTMDPIWWPELGRMLKQNQSDRLQEWLDISDQLLARRLSWHEIFPTDGHHPDRHGHRLLRDHLYPQWAHKT